MNTISLKLTTKYKSLQEGFEWNDIPPFAVVTGVNGVGKSQLLEVIQGKVNQSNNQGGNRPAISREIMSQGELVNLIFSEDVPSMGLSLYGLLEYSKRTGTRLESLRNIDQSIQNLRNKQEQYEQQHDGTSGQGIGLQNDTDITNIKHQIEQLQKQKLGLSNYVYDEELKRIALKIGVPVNELTEEDVRLNAIDNFQTLSTVEELRRFLEKEDQRFRDRLVYLAVAKQYAEQDKLVDEERPYQTINRIFKKYGFAYFEMLDPFPTDGSVKGEIRFKGKAGEIVGYNSLSSGEQAIVQFVIWSYGQDFRGNRLNTMVLDEPDAHLHPTMCKMMVEILSEITKDKEDGGSGIRIIITTHSPSTVAFAPEESLFVMKRKDDNTRVIEPTTTEDAVSILSDGIFTFSQAMSKFTMLADNPKKHIVLVEGKTDAPHYQKAMQMLGFDMDVDFIGMYGADSLSDFIKSAPAKFTNKDTLIALFDCDNKGKKCFDTLGKDCSIDGAKVIASEQSEGKYFCMKIISPRDLEAYCPVEFLYPKNVLDDNNVLLKMGYKEYMVLYKPNSPDESTTLSKEYENGSTLRPFKVKDDAKNNFSMAVMDFNEKEKFENFRPTLNVIKNIISRQEK